MSLQKRSKEAEAMAKARNTGEVVLRGLDAFDARAFFRELCRIEDVRSLDLSDIKECRNFATHLQECVCHNDRLETPSLCDVDHGDDDRMRSFLKSLCRKRNLRKLHLGHMNVHKFQHQLLDLMRRSHFIQSLHLGQNDLGGVTKTLAPGIASAKILELELAEERLAWASEET